MQPWLAGRVAAGTAYLALMNGVQLACSLFFYLALARILPRSQVGEVSLLFLIINAFGALTTVALNSAATRFISHHLGEGDAGRAAAAYRASWRLLTLISLPSFAASALLARLLSLGTSSLLALGAGLVLNYTGLMGGALFGLTLYRGVALQNIIFYVASRGGGALLAWGLGTLGVALGLLLGALASLLYSLLALRGRLGGAEGEVSPRALLSYGLPLYGTNLISLGQGWLDLLVLYGISADLSALGVYYIVVASAGTLSILWAPLSSALFPAMSFSHAGGGARAVGGMLGLSGKLALLVVMPFSFALAAGSGTALRVAFGEAYAQGALAFSIVALAALPMALSSLFATSLQSSGETRPIFVAGLASLAVDLAALVLLVPPLSGLGAALARALMALTSFAILYRRARASFGFTLRVPLALLRGALLPALAIALVELLVPAPLALKAPLEALAFFGLAPLALRGGALLDAREGALLQEALPGRLKCFARLLARGA